MGKNAFIFGAGQGLSAAIAECFNDAGMQVGLAARNAAKLEPLAEQLNGRAYACDVTDPDQVNRAFDAFEQDFGVADVVIFNAGLRVAGPIGELDTAKVRDVVLVNSYGGFLVAQRATGPMLESGGGSMLFTGASAGIKGYANSSAFAMGKFALRGLCQSLARELGPQNIHVAHFVIDGLIRNDRRGAPYNNPDTTLDPAEIARTYLNVANQDRSAWTWEMELRPWVEKF